MCKHFHRCEWHAFYVFPGGAKALCSGLWRNFPLAGVLHVRAKSKRRCTKLAVTLSSPKMHAQKVNLCTILDFLNATHSSGKTPSIMLLKTLVSKQQVYKFARNLKYGTHTCTHTRFYIFCAPLCVLQGVSLPSSSFSAAAIANFFSPGSHKER